MSGKLSTKFILSIIFFLICLVLVNLENQKTAQKVLGTQTQLKMTAENLQIWEQIVEKRPDYFDGWLHLVTIYYQTGNLNQAREALKKAKELAPTNEIVVNLEKLLTP